jgi:hypothetical protein
MKSLTKNIRISLLLIVTMLSINSQNLFAGEPVTGLLLCCRGSDRGSFLVNGVWNTGHNYGDINQVRSIMQHIKDAGINIVSIDMTNASMWVRNFDIFKPMIDNIRKVCQEKNMEYFIMIGIVLPQSIRNESGMPSYLQTIDQVEFWNNIAQQIWNDYATDSYYRTYGFGDNRKILGLFYPGELIFGTSGTGGIMGGTTVARKTYLSKFYLGSNEYNQDFVDTPTDGWGYRNTQQSSNGNIRFVCPTNGLVPSSSKRINAQQWSDRIDWAKAAAHYSVYGSYDDSLDNIQWGINDTSKATTATDVYYPGNDAYYYYNVLKNKLTSPNCTASATQWDMNAISEFGNDPSPSISNVAATGGILSYNVNGTDPFIFSKDNLNICASNNPRITIRIKNGTALGNLRMYFTTYSDAVYSEEKSVAIDISTNDANFKVYTLNMSTNVNWKETLKRLRLDAPNGSANGKVEIDYISINNNTLGIDDVTLNEEIFKIHPNPSIDGIFNLSAPQSWEVHDLLGKKVKEGSGNEINLSETVNGIYVVKVRNSNKGYKIIKE